MSDGSTPKPEDKRLTPNPAGEQNAVKHTKAPKNSNSWDALQAMVGQIDERTMAEPEHVSGAGHVSVAETVTPGVNDAGTVPVAESVKPEKSGPVSPTDSDMSDMSGFSQEEVQKAEENAAIHKKNSQEEMLQILRSLQTDVADIKVVQNKMTGDVKSISDSHTALKKRYGQ